MKVTLKVWRQPSPDRPGKFVDYQADADEEMSFLEMLDVINEDLVTRGLDPIAFDHDCREGICGTCGFMINGVAHGPRPATTLCQLHMRAFNDGDVLVLEPFRASAFPVVRDLVVDRSSFDRIVQAGGFIGNPTGSAPDANTIPVPKPIADRAMDAASCIGCGACVASCPNGAAMLFTGAFASKLNVMPQGAAERYERTARMVEQMEDEGFGSCTNYTECEAVCPKEIGIDVIAKLNWDYLATLIKGG